MRFVCPELDLDFIMDLYSPTILVVENKVCFSQLIQNLWKQYNGEAENIIVSENMALLKLDKQCEVILTPLAIDFNHRKILGRIYDDLDITGKEFYFEQVTRINQEIITLLDSLEQNIDYPITFDLDLDLKGLFKLYHIRIDEAEDDILSLLISYIKLIRRALAIKLIVFSNLKTYFSKSELIELYAACRYEEVVVIDIESFDFGKEIEVEKYIIIDKDQSFIEV